MGIVNFILGLSVLSSSLLKIHPSANDLELGRFREILLVGELVVVAAQRLWRTKFLSQMETKTPAFSTFANFQLILATEQESTV